MHPIHSNVLNAFSRFFQERIRSQRAVKCFSWASSEEAAFFEVLLALRSERRTNSPLQSN
jgi:hypothetical protein